MFMKIPKTLKITINFVKIKTEIVMNLKKHSSGLGART